VRVSRPALLACLVAILPGCKFGMDYSADELGLTRGFVLAQGRDDRTLSYLASGSPSSPRLIFIHGSPGAATGYVGYLRHPIDGLETIAVDRLGYGQSVPSGVALVRFHDQVEGIAPLLVERDGIKPIVVGHSLGGPIAARLAAEYPDEVGALFIVGGGLDPELEDVRWYNQLASAMVVNVFLADFLKVSNKEMFACKEEVQELVPLLDRITCPVVIIHGTEDSLVAYENTRFIIDGFGHNDDVRVLTLIGEDHFITMEREEEMRAAIEHVRDELTGALERRRGR
jgi:pimeloyl-ACP methyl ester carboxylesterase